MDCRRAQNKSSGFAKAMSRVRDINRLIGLGQRVWDWVQPLLSERAKPACG